MSDPFRQIRESIDAAHEANDRNADLLFLATVNGQGQPSVRTLLLRKIEDGKLLILFSKYHEKWDNLQNNQQYEVLLWYPSIGHQYRVRGRYEVASDEVTNTLWKEQPTAIKRVDLGYGNEFIPSSKCNSLKDFEKHVNEIPEEQVKSSSPPPEHVVASWLVAIHIEALVASPNRLHNRIQYTLQDGQWNEQTVIP